ncbi:MAG: hypothetical protein Q9170_003845 [Blastenia crenularia]
MAEVVYTGVADAAGVRGQLFGGVKFWLAQKANGGEVTLLEKEADVKIVDHTKKERLPGTYSYQYIEYSVRNGKLEDLSEHAIGPPTGTLRTVGSTIQPQKSGRTKFTPEDDRILVNWVHGFEQSGGATSGNEIYKQLEAKNPRHTWQSWRDRWVKYLKSLPRSAFVPPNAPPTPPAERTGAASETLSLAKPQKAVHKPFSQDDAELLLENGDDIMNIHSDRYHDAWQEWAEERDNPEDRTGKDWQEFWEKEIRPVYLKREAEAPSSSPTAEDDNQLRQGQQLPPKNLLVRMSPVKADPKSSNEPRSPSYHPEPQSNQTLAAPSEQTQQGLRGEFVDGASESRHTERSPGKRKRPAPEEIPSSSSPQPIRSAKRLRADEEESLFVEQDSVPEPDPVRGLPREIPDTFPTNVPDKVYINLVDDEESSESLDEYEDEDENEDEDYDSEKARSLSPELGRSPAKTSNDIQRNVSRTQALYNEPEIALDFDVPPPDGGFSDDEEEKFEEFEEFEDDDREAHDNTQQKDNSEEDEEEFHILEAEPQPQSFQTSNPLPPASDSNSTPPSSPPSISQKLYHPTTQAILAAETYDPDLSLPEPEGGWEAALLPSSPPELPPSSQSDSQQPQQQQPSQPPLRSHQQAPKPPSPNPADQLDKFIDYHLSVGYTEDSVQLALKCTNMDPVLTVRVLESMKGNGWEVPRDVKGCWTEDDDGDLESVDARRIKRVEEKHGKGAVEARWEFLEEYRR